MPYPGVDPFSLVKFLEAGQRLEKPSNTACTDEMWVVIAVPFSFSSSPSPPLPPFLYVLTSSSPPFSSSSSYSIVLRCWCENADKRPPFSELVTDITTSLEAIAGYMDFSCLSFVDKKEDEEVHPYDHLAEQDTWNNFADSSSAFDVAM